MTKEEKKQIEELNSFISKLEPYAKHLGTALHGYINITPEATRKLLESYYGLDWKSKVKPNVLSCGACKLNTIKSIALEFEAAKNTIQMIVDKDEKKKGSKAKKDNNVE